MCIARFAENIAVGREWPDLPLGDQIPEGLQLAQTVLGWIAGDDRRIDRTDGDARHPVGLDPGLMHRLIDPGLIGAERAAALQDKCNPVAARHPSPGRAGSVAWSIGRVRTSCMANHSKMRMGNRFSALPKQVTAR